MGRRGLGGLGRGGNGGPGIGLVGGAVGVNQCLSDDTSWYCTLSRTYSVFMMLVMMLFILYFAYTLFKGSKRRWF
jgi:hypothetical protein